MPLVSRRYSAVGIVSDRSVTGDRAFDEISITLNGQARTENRNITFLTLFFRLETTGQLDGNNGLTQIQTPVQRKFTSLQVS